MDRRLSAKLKSFSVIGLDTSVFIYHFEQNPAYHPLTHHIFSSLEQGRLRAVTSAITLMEIIVHPLALNQQDVARKYEALLINFPNLSIIDLDREAIRQAARLRAEYRLRPPDALQVAVSLISGAEAFITNDRRLERLQDRLEVVLLEKFID